MTSGGQFAPAAAVAGLLATGWNGSPSRPSLSAIWSQRPAGEVVRTATPVPVAVVKLRDVDCPS